MYEVIQVRLREAGKITHFSPSGMKFKVGDYVIVESDRGLDYGQVVSEKAAILDSDLEEPLKKVVRKANPWDMHQVEKNKKKVREVMDTCSKKIQDRKIPMKLIDAEFAFDRSKIMFYFTAEGRVDFRDLVKDLANVFKTRIELKQIGVRDEAKRARLAELAPHALRYDDGHRRSVVQGAGVAGRQRAVGRQERRELRQILEVGRNRALIARFLGVGAQRRDLLDETAI